MWFVIINTWVVLIWRISCCKRTWHSRFSGHIEEKNGHNDEQLKFRINFDEGFLVTYRVKCKISGNNNGDNNVRRLEECLSPRQDRQCTYNITTRHVHATTAAVEKIISTTYSKCVFVAFVIQHAKHKCLSWRMKDQLDVTCYFISLLMCSTCFGY